MRKHGSPRAVVSTRPLASGHRRGGLPTQLRRVACLATLLLPRPHAHVHALREDDSRVVFQRQLVAVRVGRIVARAEVVALQARRQDEGDGHLRECPTDARARPRAKGRIHEVPPIQNALHVALDILLAEPELAAPLLLHRHQVGFQEAVRIELHGVLPHARIAAHGVAAQQNEISLLDRVARGQLVVTAGQPGKKVNGRVHSQPLLDDALDELQPALLNVLVRGHAAA
mmetsp:Transcript_5058/g.20138  ORF Transcript_5058/g.20138 Transcript_5058/m.20138 type:complete len:229 (-) Transcript_5058:1908-2594(-)